MVKNPSEGPYYAFPPTTQICGPTASVLRYNLLSRLLVTILVRIFAIPSIGYYDDYGFLAPSDISGAAMRLVCRVCDLLCITLKPGKCRIAGTNNFLGLTVSFPRWGNDYALTIALAPDKSLKWKRIIDQIGGAGTVSHNVLESDIGRIGFAQGAVFRVSPDA